MKHAIWRFTDPPVQWTSHRILQPVRNTAWRKNASVVSFVVSRRNRLSPRDIRLCAAGRFGAASVPSISTIRRTLKECHT